VRRKGRRRNWPSGGFQTAKFPRSGSPRSATPAFQQVADVGPWVVGCGYGAFDNQSQRLVVRLSDGGCGWCRAFSRIIRLAGRLVSTASTSISRRTTSTTIAASPASGSTPSARAFRPIERNTTVKRTGAARRVRRLDGVRGDGQRGGRFNSASSSAMRRSAVIRASVSKPRASAFARRASASIRGVSVSVRSASDRVGTSAALLVEIFGRVSAGGMRRVMSPSESRAKRGSTESRPCRHRCLPERRLRDSGRAARGIPRRGRAATPLRQPP
jgi:hypothetical protein